MTAGSPAQGFTLFNTARQAPSAGRVSYLGPNGEQVGIVAIGDALRLAQEADLDLVEVAPMARPPVCKLMDYGKFKYESAQKAREGRRNQALTVIKEMKLRPKIDPHDYATKRGHVVRFLKAGDKVITEGLVKVFPGAPDRTTLVTGNGDFVQGYGVDTTGNIIPGQLQNLVIPGSVTVTVPSSADINCVASSKHRSI